MTRRNDKRQRLIEAADTLFHQQGVSITTLADIANLAGIPLGNVYYYFKSKDSIITSVIERRSQDLQALLTQLNSQTSDPAERLALYLQNNESTLDRMMAYGEHTSSLCQEVSKEGKTTH
ncbi:MAG: TetR/AcrR family transcriptional regulator, partial [Pseudomonadota bacterium]